MPGVRYSVDRAGQMNLPDYWYMWIPVGIFVVGWIWAIWGPSPKSRQKTNWRDYCTCPKGFWGNPTGWDYSCPRHGKR